MPDNFLTSLCETDSLFLQLFLPPHWEKAVVTKSCLLATPSSPGAGSCPSLCPQLEGRRRLILTPPSQVPSQELTLTFPRGFFNGGGFLIAPIQALNGSVPSGMSGYICKQMSLSPSASFLGRPPVWYILN